MLKVNSFKFTKKSLLAGLVLVLLAGLLLWGVHKGFCNAKANSRIKATLKCCPQNEVKLRSILKQATPNSLKTPDIYDALLIENQKSNRAVLVVHWIEYSPTPSAIRIYNPATDFSEVYPIDPADLEENEKESKRGVIAYVMGLGWSFSDSRWANIRKAVKAGANIELMANGKAISPPYKLRYIFKPHQPNK